MFFACHSLVRTLRRNPSTRPSVRPSRFSTAFSIVGTLLTATSSFFQIAQRRLRKWRHGNECAFFLKSDLISFQWRRKLSFDGGTFLNLVPWGASLSVEFLITVVRTMQTCRRMRHTAARSRVLNVLNHKAWSSLEFISFLFVGLL